MQYKCEIGDEELKSKKQIAALASSISILSSLLLGCFIYYEKRIIDIDKQNFDLNNITASDYTLSLDLTYDQSLYLANLPGYEHASVGLRIKYQLNKKIHEFLKVSQNEVLVSDYNFIFKNGHIFRALEKRSKYINKNDPIKVRKAEKDL